MYPERKKGSAPKKENSNQPKVTIKKPSLALSSALFLRVNRYPAKPKIILKQMVMIKAFISFSLKKKAISNGGIKEIPRKMTSALSILIITFV